MPIFTSKYKIIVSSQESDIKLAKEQGMKELKVKSSKPKFNFIKKLFGLFSKKEKSRLTESEIDNLIDKHKEILEQLEDDSK
tara:strand:+ start:523 stop:768 length:246 start_codon:yes stop_codon:yes gene_type:complete